MRKLALVAACLLGVSLVAAASPRAERRALPCGLKDRDGTAWIDYGWPEFADIFARKGVILATSTGEFPARMRAAGAGTVHWDMNLKNRVGRPDAPADPATIVDRANRLFDFAVQQTGCPTPLIAENELFGAGLPTPWSQTNEVYRSNVLVFLKTLSERGARPFLLVSSPAYTAGEAGDWWREVAKHADLVRQVYPSAKALHRMGPIGGNRYLRTAMRRGIANFTEIGIPTSRLGVMLAFQTGKGHGGREGLEPASAWLRVAKWQALSAKAVAKETRLASVWSWGWGNWSATPNDLDKRGAACVWLWARDRTLCNGPAAAGPGFVASLTEGQIILPSGAQCRVGDDTLLRSGDIAVLQRLTGDRDVATGALLARSTEAAWVKVTTKEILAAERAVIAEQFRGNRAAYRAALAAAGANVTIARGILGDAIRRVRIQRTLRVPPPNGGAVATFYRSYPELLARPVTVKPAASWLGWRTRGWAFESIAPQTVFTIPGRAKRTVRSLEGVFQVRTTAEARPLATLPLATVAPSIRSVLQLFGRRVAFESWTTARQVEALRTAICRRDALPVPSAVELVDYLPFLAAAR